MTISIEVGQVAQIIGVSGFRKGELLCITGVKTRIFRVKEVQGSEGTLVVEAGERPNARMPNLRRREAQWKTERRGYRR